VSLATPEKLRRLQRALYDKAKRDPGYRFYALYDKVWREDVIEHAYRLCRENGGAPGVDGVTFAQIEADGLERWLGELREEVRTGRYRTQPVRRVMIPKAWGDGERPLGIPAIRDRVVQTAAKLILEPIFEADFDDAAYGYRPNRSAMQAVKRVHEALMRGHTEVVDADLAKYFDNIPHSQLMKSLARRISDGRMLHLLKMWLKAPVEERDERGKRTLTGGKKATRGMPRGGVISPPLANVYMHRYIKAFRKHGLAEEHGAELVVYADDLVVLCRRNAQQVLENTRRWMGQIGLTVNEAKTSVRDAWRESFDLLGYTFGPMYSPRSGKRYLGATPSKKAIRRFRENVHARLRRSNLAPEGEVVTQLNRFLRGWASYFGYGTIAGVRHALDQYVTERVRHFLTRRHRVRSRGTAVYPQKAIHAELSVLDLTQLPRHRFANALS
jgi:RNA-directed DNA polymerase